MTHKLLRGKTAKVAAAAVTSAGLLVGGVAGGIAIADHSTQHRTFSGGGDTSTRVATDDAGYAPASSNTWEHVTGSSLAVSVPSGSVRLVQAFFSAESSSSGGSWCAVRIVAKKSTSATLHELYPRAGTEFAFDSPGGEAYEAHAMKRTIRLGAGSWSLRVNVNAVGGGSCFLDDWYFDVESHTAS